MSEGERSSPEETARPLKFESRFESGNLRKAIQVWKRSHSVNIYEHNLGTCYFLLHSPCNVQQSMHG